MNTPIRIQLELPAAHRFLNIIGGCIQELINRTPNLSDPESLSYQLQLAAQEVCANIIDHAYQGMDGNRIWIEFQLDESVPQLTALFSDEGQPFNNAEPNLSDLPGEGGMGLFLIHQLVDHVEYQRTQNRNTWVLTKTLA